jgi:3-hydroxyacyl-CoA dehydrogenase/3a,7a,12a-trihydroxy-5b-cholest-24-enoyl-CoA hydratase
VVNALKPEFVTPMVVYLVHEKCNTSGGVLEAGGGWYGQRKCVAKLFVHGYI